MATPLIAHGSKFGIHAIRPGQVIPLVRQAHERGVVWPLVKSVSNGGVAIDVKKIEPRTLTIVRFVNDQEDGAQGVGQWTPAEMRAHAQKAVDAVWKRLNQDEKAAADWFEPINEADPPGVEGWRAFGEYIKIIIDEGNQRGMKLALPAFCAGTPEWDEAQALVGTGVFAAMKAGGHILTLHEGVLGDAAPVDQGFGDLIPGSPAVAGAGSMCFRYRYLYSLLQARDEVVPLVVSEFYAGGGYGSPPAEHVKRFAWYDQQTRQDPYVLAVLPFTIDPDDGWRQQDYTPAYPALLDYLVAEKDKANATAPVTVVTNPVVTIPVVTNPPVTTPPAPAIVTRLGLHGRADGRMQPADFQVVREARIEAVKLLSTADPADVDRLHDLDSKPFVMVRCFVDFRNRVVTAQDFAHSMAGDLAPFYAKGIRHFEIHNEPNLTGEGQIFPGQTGTWANGTEFGNWFTAVKAQLSQTFSEAKWGWPGLSPGDDISGVRQNADRFLTEAGSAPASADWIGLHAYWIDGDGLQAAIDSVAAYAQRFPGHTLYVTEFANPDKGVDMAIKGRQYLAFWRGMRTLPVAAVFSFVSSASNAEFAAQAWRDEGGQLSTIPGIVGARTVLPARWWDAWPSGIITPTRRLAVPPAPVEIVDGNGQPLVPPVSRQNGMDVFERQGDLLRVFDQPLHGQFWWVRAADVQPELA